ncbi:DUF2312 domain-containing protein [Bradyrhizobium sp. UFLA06-06]
MQELGEQKEVSSEVKGEDFDVKIRKEIVKPRKRDQDERESLLDLYVRVMETAPAGEATKAA